jgi:hypothetical protein
MRALFLFLFHGMKSDLPRRFAGGCFGLFDKERNLLNGSQNFIRRVIVFGFQKYSAIISSPDGMNVESISPNKTKEVDGIFGGGRFS